MDYFYVYCTVNYDKEKLLVVKSLRGCPLRLIDIKKQVFFNFLELFDYMWTDLLVFEGGNLTEVSGENYTFDKNTSVNIISYKVEKRLALQNYMHKYANNHNVSSYFLTKDNSN